MNKLLVTTFVAVMALFSVKESAAAPILGGSLYVSETGTVDATFIGQTAGYTNDLYLYVWDATSGTFQKDNAIGMIFSNHSTPVGTTKALGTFTAGQELVFGIFVNNTGDTFFTGEGSRNADGLAHAVVNDQYVYNGVNMTYVGFEDLLKGGDKDYDDLVFGFTNTSSNVPEPTILSMFGIGLLALAFRKKSKV